jgi:hypothetical protein
MHRLYTCSAKWNEKIKNGELDKDTEGGGHGLFEGPILALPGQTEGNHEYPWPGEATYNSDSKQLLPEWSPQH